MKRIPPYLHADKSNCWTKNCSRGNSAIIEVTNKEKFINEMLEAQKVNQRTTVKPTFISSIATQEEFDAAVAQGDVSRQRHPLYPYSIYKYSQATTYSKNWNGITLASRGLIVNDETGEILARPFGKFFNYSEGATPPELMAGPISVTEKMDGSLGITFPTPDGLQISTAGGFQSPQAAHATEVYRERYEGNWEPRKGTTYLYEIIYPNNRIVVDYGDEDDIHLLGAVNIETGKSIPISELSEWKWKKATEHTSLKEISSVVNAPDRRNHEGYIVHFTQTDTRVKLKHEEYLLHHRYATNINSKTIWSMLRDSDDDMQSWRKNAPEEFEGYINTAVSNLTAQYNEEEKKVYAQYNKITNALPKDVSQKDFALKVNADAPYAYRGLMFTLRQNGKITEMAKQKIWDMFKPEHEPSIWSLKNGRSDTDVSES